MYPIHYRHHPEERQKGNPKRIKVRLMTHIFFCAIRGNFVFKVFHGDDIKVGDLRRGGKSLNPLKYDSVLLRKGTAKWQGR